MTSWHGTILLASSAKLTTKNALIRFLVDVILLVDELRQGLRAPAKLFDYIRRSSAQAVGNAHSGLLKGRSKSVWGPRSRSCARPGPSRPRGHQAGGGRSCARETSSGARRRGRRGPPGGPRCGGGRGRRSAGG